MELNETTIESNILSFETNYLKFLNISSINTIYCSYIKETNQVILFLSYPKSSRARAFLFSGFVIISFIINIFSGINSLNESVCNEFIASKVYSSNNFFVGFLLTKKHFNI